MRVGAPQSRARHCNSTKGPRVLEAHCPPQLAARSSPITYRRNVALRYSKAVGLSALCFAAEPRRALLTSDVPSGRILNHCIHFNPEDVCRVSRVLVTGLKEELMTFSNTLSAKEQVLVGIGAAIVAGCQPCTTRLIRSARAAGACERSIRLAIESGRSASTSAIEAMVLWAEREQGQTPELDETFRLEKEKLAALISAGAAYAAHSTATLDRQLLNAQAYDWTNVQIAEALSVASTVAKTAAGKVEAAAARVGFPIAKLDDSCCSESRAADSSQTPASDGCGCAKSAQGT